MNFSEAFKFVFQDPDWFKKIIIPGLVGLLIPIVGSLVLVGWGLKVTLNLIRHNPTPLPSMDFGEDLKRGFKAFVVSLVYSLPILILYIPIIVITALVGDSNENTMLALVSIASLCFGFLILVYSIVMALMLPAAYARTVVEDRIGAGLEFGKVFTMVKNNLVTYLLVVVGMLIANLIGSLGTIVCVIGMFVTIPYAFAITGHLTGQSYLEATKSAAPY